MYAATFTLSAQLTALACVFVIAVVISWIVYRFHLTHGAHAGPFQQKLAIALISAAVTAIPTILILTTWAFTEGAGQSGGSIYFSVAAIVVIWVVIFMILAKSKLGSLRLHQLSSKDLERHYQALGHVYYRKWRANPWFRQVIEEEKLENRFIDDLLPKVFYHGPHDVPKPQNVINSTIFFFTEAGAVKFQRIRGTAEAVDGKWPQIYLPHTSSTPGGKTTCLNFTRNGDKIHQTSQHMHGEWKMAPLDNVDLLIVTVYREDEIKSGDYVYVDISKYADPDPGHGAAVELAIVSDRRIVDFNVWEVCATQVSAEKPVPLMFHRLKTQTNRRAEAKVRRNLLLIRRRFERWDELMNMAAAGECGQLVNVSKWDVEEVLRDVKDVLAGYKPDSGDFSFRDLFGRLAAKDCVVARLRDQRNVILSTFTWG